MKFSKVIGDVDSKLVAQAEDKLSSIFIELATSYGNTSVGSGIGGDPFIFSLLYPMEHICTVNMPTAGTDGKRYYWNPSFVMKLDKIGLRIVAAHEAAHAIYMHPQRRGSRLPKLWNIAVDYIVNGLVMEDFKARNFNADDMFREHLGNFVTLEDYANVLRDPFNSKIPGVDLDAKPPKLPDPSEERELTEEEKKALEEYENKVKCFFADSNLSDDMKNPEKIYDYLYSLLPKCDVCGSVGVYKNPNSDKENSKKKKKKNKKDQSDPSNDGNDTNHNHGNSDQQCSCPGCGGGFDVFGFGDTLDDHIDTEESEEKLAKRVAEAAEAAKRMAGHVPASIEAEIGKLTEPKITWKDVIRGQLLRSRAGNDRNDWTRFRTRPLFAGLMNPKRKNYQAGFGCLVDCSGSMSADDIAFGLSQLKSLDDRSEGTLVPADSEIYWSQSTKIRSCKEEELLKFKRVGLGGTMFSDFFSDYEKEIGKQDFLIIITDAYLLDTDIAAMKDPGIPVYWLVTSAYQFKAPFGKVYALK